MPRHRIASADLYSRRGQAAREDARGWNGWTRDRADRPQRDGQANVGVFRLTWLNVFHWLGIALLVSLCMGTAVRVMAKELRDMVRQGEVIEAFSNLRRWADVNGFTILLREQVWDSPSLDNGGAQVVFRVVVQDRSGQRKWARVRSGKRFDVRWIKPESSFASSRSQDDPLWDQELDRHVSIPRELPLILVGRPIMAIAPLTDAGSQPLR